MLVECKVTRADFLADAAKPFRLKPEDGMGSQRFYLAPTRIVRAEELPRHWGLLELRGHAVRDTGNHTADGELALSEQVGLVAAKLIGAELIR